MTRFRATPPIYTARAQRTPGPDCSPSRWKLCLALAVALSLALYALAALLIRAVLRAVL
jgi:hypothetical protein